MKDKEKIFFYPIYKDRMFKWLFGTETNKRFTIDLLEKYFKLKPESLKDLEILNSVALETSNIKERGYELDVKVKLPDGSLIDIEMQHTYNKIAELKSYTYLTKMFSTELKTRDKIKNIKSVTSINFIKDLDIHKNKKTMQEYYVTNKDNINDKILPDFFKMVLIDVENICESFEKVNKEFVNWIKFIKADTIEELREAASKNIILTEALKECENYMSTYYVQDLALQEKFLRWEKEEEERLKKEKEEEEARLKKEKEEEEARLKREKEEEEARLKKQKEIEYKRKQQEKAKQFEKALNERKNIFERELKEREANAERELKEREANAERELKEREANAERKLKERRANIERKLDELKANTEKEIKEKKDNFEKEINKLREKYKESNKLEGKLEEKYELVGIMHQNNEPIDKIMLYTNLPKEEIINITKSLNNNKLSLKKNSITDVLHDNRGFIILERSHLKNRQTKKKDK